MLKIAILAEKFASDLRWYVDVILQLISHAGDFVSDDIWCVTNFPGVLSCYLLDEWL